MQDQSRLFAGIALSVGLILSSWIAANAYVSTHQADQNIAITGSAKKRIVSDKIQWTAAIQIKATTMADAYKKISGQVPLVVNYLVKKGVDNKEIEISSVETIELHPQNDKGFTQENVISGYFLRQYITVKSTKVAEIAQIAREATELINQGIFIESHQPQYYYTKLGDLKVEMLAEASKDAKLRAEQIATSTGAKVGALRSARMGVLQINPADSTATSGEGNNDVSSLEKDIIAVVSINFGLEN